jgi:hypothetical protein
MSMHLYQRQKEGPCLRSDPALQWLQETDHGVGDLQFGRESAMPHWSASSGLICQANFFELLSQPERRVLH